MKTKHLIAILIFCMVSKTFSQTNLNDYKYVIVPNKFDFLNQEDKYQLNSLAKFLFNKYGFTALSENESYTKDLSNNNCLALRGHVTSKKGMFKTRLTVILKNCKNETVFTSEIGESNEKDFKTAYHLALRNAFESFENVNYSYDQEATKTEEIIKKNEPEETKEETVKPEEEVKELKIQQVENIVVISIEETKQEVVDFPKSDENLNSEILYAQRIEKGFQIVDKTPQVIMILLKTTLENVFIVENENAIVYKEDGFWYISKNDGKNLSIETLSIKF